MNDSPTLTPPDRHAARPGLVLLGYALMLAAAVGLFFLIRWHGETLPTAPVTVTPAKDVPTAGRMDVLIHVLLALAAIVVSGRLLAWLFKRLGQPPVVGEVIAGILLGPSLLG